MLSDGSDDPIVGPICISIEDGTSEDRKCYMRTKKGIQRFIIPVAHTGTMKDMTRFIKSTFTELRDMKFSEIGYDPELVTKLVEYEAQLILYKYKFGLLYVKEGQTDEDEMFSNTETSSDYEDFLEFLGDNIILQVTIYLI